MPSVRVCRVKWTLTPFLYPFLDENFLCASRTAARFRTPLVRHSNITTATYSLGELPPPSLEDAPELKQSRLNPPPDSYSSTPFTDRCTLTLHAGGGGHGCVSFLREKYVEAGPANGGDGGSGGSIYIQAVRGETSLHKLARRGTVKAGRGKNGQGKGQGGERGEDILITVPVGTILREVWRHDPVAEEEERLLREKGENPDAEGYQRGGGSREKWLLYPGSLPSTLATTEFPTVPIRRSSLATMQPQAPIRLDLDKPMERPMLLAAGATGGLGNPHFVNRSTPRPKFATKGEGGMRINVQLELKLLADVGLVGLPNAGKSTLLRSLSNSRARIGNWAFTTLQPNIGTVVLDNYKGRPLIKRNKRTGEQRTSFTIADIPGLIEDAHLDKGLGLGFLRHIERAAILAFVVDLSAGDAVAALKGLWAEVGEYEDLKGEELNSETERRLAAGKEVIGWSPFGSESPMHEDGEENEEAEVVEEGELAEADETIVLKPPRSQELPPLTMAPISSKPWFVVATKADLPETQANFLALQAHLDAVSTGTDKHPSGRKNAWRKRLHAIPVSAINAEGVGRIPEVVMDLLDE